MTGHTPGPWDVSAFRFIHAPGQASNICAMSRPKGGEYVGYYPPQGLRESDAELAEISANARLIAAAPELLTLAVQYLSDMRHPVTDSGSRQRRIEAIEAVLTKATNKENTK